MWELILAHKKGGILATNVPQSEMILQSWIAKLRLLSCLTFTYVFGQENIDRHITSLITFGTDKQSITHAEKKVDFFVLVKNKLKTKAF